MSKKYSRSDTLKALEQLGQNSKYDCQFDDCFNSYTRYLMYINKKLLDDEDFDFEEEEEFDKLSKLFMATQDIGYEESEGLVHWFDKACLQWAEEWDNLIRDAFNDNISTILYYDAIGESSWSIIDKLSSSYKVLSLIYAVVKSLKYDLESIINHTDIEHITSNDNRYCTNDVGCELISDNTPNHDIWRFYRMTYDTNLQDKVLEECLIFVSSNIDDNKEVLSKRSNKLHQIHETANDRVTKWMNRKNTLIHKEDVDNIVITAFSIFKTYQIQAHYNIKSTIYDNVPFTSCGVYNDMLSHVNQYIIKTANSNDTIVSDDNINTWMDYARYKANQLAKIPGFIVI